jgi:hypothetical protein
MNRLKPLKAHSVITADSLDTHFPLQGVQLLLKIGIKQELDWLKLFASAADIQR